ncbi:MFS transporter [Microlunatus soli]|uniref:Major Facilitator Superfamily protein n=1 Tax=Microlunatus soli TaxID=630515 RepID=A0A1H1NQ02_9ACTN|nr:hypothetical protein [Microlunatus soli]SDS00983.1 hypothetical protein SAMN04489812_0600 [Microlunatus soli]
MINNAATGNRDRKPFVAFSVAETLSSSGTRLSMIAIPWLVLTTTTDSASMTGMVDQAFSTVMLPVWAKESGHGFFSLQPGLPAVLTVCTIAGLASGFINPIIGAVVFERIPQSLTGRVTALNGSLTWSPMPFGGLLGGLLVTGVGLPIASLMAGAGYFLVTLMPVAKKSFRSFGLRPCADDQTVLTSPASTITSDPVVLPDRGDASNTI